MTEEDAEMTADNTGMRHTARSTKRRALGGVRCVLKMLFTVLLWVVPVVGIHGETVGATEKIDAVFSRYIQLGKDLTEVLDKVKDKKSAAENTAALQEILPRVGEIRREIGSIDKLRPEDAKEVSAKYERSMRETWGNVFANIYRLQRERCYEEIPFFRAFSILCSLLDS